MKTKKMEIKLNLRKLLFLIIILNIICIMFSVSYASEQRLYQNEQHDAINRKELTLNLSADADVIISAIKKEDAFVEALYTTIYIDTANLKGLEKLDLIENARVNKDSILCSFSEFDFNKNSEVFTCSLRAIIKSTHKFPKVNQKIIYPKHYYSTQDENINYLKSTNYFTSDNKDIINLGRELMITDDAYQNIAGIFNWITKNIGFDPNYYISKPTGFNVLMDKRANVFGLNSLFISLCRSQNIPAKLVEGVALDSDAKFKTHYWSEAYLPGFGFLPFDLLYGQIGYVDATHIKFREISEIDTGIVASNIPDKSGIAAELLKPVIDASIISKGEYLKSEINVSLSVYSENCSFGSYNILKLNLLNKNDYYYPASIRIITPPEIEIIGNFEKHVLLRPESNQTMIFLLKVDENLDSRKIYSFNIKANVDWQTKNISFKSSVNADKVDLSSLRSFFIESASINNEFSADLALQDNLRKTPAGSEIDKTNNAVSITHSYDEKSDKGEITIKISPNRELYDFMLYEEIPKCLAKAIEDIIYEKTNARVINPDPILVWEFDEVKQDIEIKFSVKKEFNLEDCDDIIKTLAVAERISQEYIKKSFFERNSFAFISLSIIVLVIIVSALIYFKRFKPEEI